MFNSVSLYTNKLKQVRRFYMNIMEFEIIATEDTHFTIKIGTSELTFIETTEDASYHYAINIPGNQFVIMKEWLQQKYQLSKNGGVNQVYNPSFDADSMFLEDPAGNLIELIGRRDRDFLGSFTRDAFYDISEVTIVSPHVVDIGEQIQDINLPLQYGIEANPERINYLGKDDTFIVLVKDKRKMDFRESELRTHPLEITLDNEKHLILNADGTLIIS